MIFHLGDIWAAAGVLMGFQVTLFTWRVSREVQVGQKGDVTWLPPADMLNLLSMLVVTLGVFVLPILGWVNFNFIKYSFGLAMLLFVGYPFALAGHYELYNNHTQRSYNYFPIQEKVVVIAVSLGILLYLCRLLG